LELSREQLIDLAICIGTDFNEGMHRAGAKTALKLIKKHGDIETLIREEDRNIRACAPLEEIREFFMNPPVTEDYSFKWKKPDSDSLFDYLVNDRDFSEKQVLKNVQVLEEQATSECQSCLGDW
jgi:flap endonuclease-1